VSRIQHWLFYKSITPSGGLVCFPVWASELTDFRSRGDAFYGDNHSFNRSVFAETRSFWKGDTITLQQAADSRLARVVSSVRTNPQFTLSQLGSDFGYGEVAAYLIIFGDGVKGTAPKNLVEYFFGMHS
jgi:hypothetical protein